MARGEQIRETCVAAQEAALQFLREDTLKPMSVLTPSGKLARPDETIPHVWCFNLASEKANSGDRFLQFVAQQYVQGAHPQGLKIVRAPGGKPILLPQDALPSLSFSIAHSGAFLCVVISTAASIGIDIELMRSVKEANKIMHRWFQADEMLALRCLPDEHQEAGFLKLWVGMEALAKRHGAGLRLLSASNAELAIASPYWLGKLSLIECGETLTAALASTSPIEGWIKYEVPQGVSPLSACAQ